MYGTSTDPFQGYSWGGTLLSTTGGRTATKGGNLPGLQLPCLYCCHSKGWAKEQGVLAGSVKDGRKINEGGCCTWAPPCSLRSCPGRAALTGTMPSAFKDEHNVLRIAGRRRGWCILSSSGLVAGQSYHVPLPPLRLSSRLHQVGGGDVKQLAQAV